MAALWAAPLGAAPYVGTAYEPFNYGIAVDAGNTAGDGNLSLNNGGTGWNATGDATIPNTTLWGSGTNSIAVTGTTMVAGSLTSLVPGSGNRITVSAGGAGRAFGQTVDSGTFYISYSMQRNTDSIRTINLALFAGATEKFGFGQYATATAGATSDGNLAAVFLNLNPANLVIGSGGVTPIPCGTGIPHQIIIRIDFDVNGANDRVRVYVDPVSVADESTLTPYVDNSGFDMTALTTVRPFSGSATTTGVILPASSGQFDEIRVGSTFASVTTAVAVVTSPPLNISSAAGEVTISWPSPSTGWTLRQNDLLSAGTWTPSTGIQDDGQVKKLVIPSPVGRQFFRLFPP